MEIVDCKTHSGVRQCEVKDGQPLDGEVSVRVGQVTGGFAVVTRVNGGGVDFGEMVGLMGATARDREVRSLVGVLMSCWVLGI